MPRKERTLLSFEGSTAVITGAGRGIGRALALELAARGVRVAICARSTDQLQGVAAQIEQRGGQALALPTDVSQEAEVERFFAQAHSRFGRVDYLVNCAGIIASRPFVEMDTATWDAVLGINLRGTFLCCRAAFRLMIPQGGGHILNMSSLSGVKGVEKFKGFSAYNVSKYGVSGLSEILAVEGRTHNIRVNVLSPGAVDTAMLAQAAPGLKAGTTPEEVANFIAFLLSDDARLLTGSNIEIFSNA